MTPPRKSLLLKNHGGGQNPHRVIAPVKKKEILNQLHFMDFYFFINQNSVTFKMALIKKTASIQLLKGDHDWKM
jgi:hypothetical protein